MMLFSIMALLLLAGGVAFLVPPLWGQTRAMACVLSIAFPAASGAVYLAVGTPAAIGQNGALRASAPEDGEGWHRLARAYATLGRYQDALLAYERAAQRLPANAQLLADFADIAAMAQGRRLEGLPETLIARALEADPNNLKALSLAGTAAFEKGEFRAASLRWRKLLDLVPPESDVARSVRGSIADAERRTGRR